MVVCRVHSMRPATVLAAIFFTLLASRLSPAAEQAARADKARGAEAILLAVPTPETFSAHLKVLTRAPHPTGSPRNMELAQYVRDRFVEYGLEDVEFHDTPALLSRPVSASVTLVAPASAPLKLREDAYPADPDSGLYRNGAFIPYHAYAASGDVTAEVIYANNGGPEDFAALAKMHIDPRGRIVLMRYSEPYSYRGYKVFLAQSAGAAGVLIYSDPKDDGFVRGPVYPDGPWGPPSHLQLGSIVYDWLGPGDPLTFHWKRRGDGWVEGRERHEQLAKIPSIPLSHEDAARILKTLGGPEAPEGWTGGLPMRYHVGPGPARVRLSVENRESIGVIRNVIGRIRGAEQPDRLVVTGNHRDAWVYGAVDPSGGTAALLEVARAFGEAARAGHRPRRTVVFANWDAEEDLLGGSTSWVQDNAERLRRDGVVYVNVDEGASGPDFGGGATPALGAFLKDVTRAVPHPAGGSVYDVWARRSRDGAPEVGHIVGATDYTAFQEHLGMSCVDLAFSGPYGVYHSQYDDYFWMSRIGDPGFRTNTALARLWSLILWRLADAPVLPMRYSDYARAIPGYIDGIEAMAAARGVSPPPKMADARRSAARWGEAARMYEAALDGAGRGGAALSRDTAARLDDLALAVERAMTERSGLATRPFFKHLIYAPQPTYREEILPRLFEAIEAGRYESIPEHEAELVQAFERAAHLAERARRLVENDAAAAPSAAAAPPSAVSATSAK